MEIPSLSHSRIPNRTELSPYFFGCTVCNVAVPVVLPIDGIGSAEETILLDLNFIEAMLNFKFGLRHRGQLWANTYPELFRIRIIL